MNKVVKIIFIQKYFSVATVTSETSASVENILQIFKIFKLVRIAKLIRHSTGLQAIAVTLISSYKELTLLFLLICIAGLLFSSFVYFIEMDEVVNTNMNIL